MSIMQVGARFRRRQGLFTYDAPVSETPGSRDGMSSYHGAALPAWKDAGR
jgi:hypothetical protein